VPASAVSLLHPRLAHYNGAEASLAATLQAWLEQYNVGHLWPLVQKVLDDDRLLLIIDGLDEWASENAARSALTALETFLDQRRLPALTSTRPYGLSRLQPTGLLLGSPTYRSSCEPPAKSRAGAGRGAAVSWLPHVHSQQSRLGHSGGSIRRRERPHRQRPAGPPP
jgi:hypothetical protein